MEDKLSLPNEDEEYEMYMLLCEKLKGFGYEQYEISNFSKKGYYSRHNMKYWQSLEYVGFGPAAHSCFDGCRYYYDRDIEKYIHKPEKVFDCENDGQSVAKIDKMDEYVMLKLRLCQGVREDEFFERFSTPFTVEYPLVNKFVESGHMVHENGAYRMNSKGFFVSNYILTEILHF